MPPGHRSRLNELDADGIKVHFSSGVKSALADLEAAVHFSEHFDGDAKAILNSWGHEAPSIHDVMVALPLIAEETFGHVRATGDKRAEDAWRKLCDQMPEHGFTLTNKAIRR